MLSARALYMTWHLDGAGPLYGPDKPPATAAVSR